MIEARLYDADGTDRRIPAEALATSRPGPQQLLWVDVLTPEPADLQALGDALGLVPGAFSGDFRRGPGLVRLGDHFRVDVVPVTVLAGPGFQGAALSIIAGGNVVLTLHDEPIACLDALHESQRGDSDLGVLSADSFAASLLDWQLSTYFSAVADFERDLERLEVDILDGRSRECMDELRRLRRAASRLRRMLASHRPVFAGLSRPDFRPSVGEDVQRHFVALDTRFERAMDVVEHARELVIGSFELFSSQTALRTNRAMSILTFATVVLGALAVMSGVMGMNFEASFFATRDVGFWGMIGVMLVLAAAAVLVGRKKEWI
jgi:magnesium transporter